MTVDPRHLEHLAQHASAVAGWPEESGERIAKAQSATWRPGARRGETREGARPGAADQRTGIREEEQSPV